MKRLIYQVHSWLGVLAALILTVVGLTGSALVFKQEIDGLCAPDVVCVADPARPRLGYDAFLAALARELPDHQIVGWGMAERPGAADSVYVIPRGASEGRMLYVDGSTGVPRGAGVSSGKTFGDCLLELHYTLLAGHAGELLVGLCGVVFCLLALTGVVLYRNFWKSLLRLRWRMSARIFFSDLHKMVGISSTVFNLIVGFTGAWWNLSHLIGHLGDEAPEAVVREIGRHWAEGVSIDRMVSTAKEALPGYQVGWLSLPQTTGGNVMLFGAIEGQGALRSQYGSVVVFEGESGQLKSATAARDAGLAAQMLDAFRPLHYGNFGGLPVKLLWCAGGFAPALLSVSGCFLWWRRKFRPRRR